MRIAGVIPLYNHGNTVAAVAEKCKCFLSDVLVIDDGSSDLTAGTVAQITAAGVELIRLERNRGKGFALKTAAGILAERGFDYMITLDADGQHDPEDIPEFLKEEIQDYLNRLYKYPENERIFPLGAEAVQHMMKAHIEMAGVKKSEYMILDIPM